jgi:pantothenate synthetase
VVLHDGHQTAVAIVTDVFDKSDCSPVMKIYVRPDQFGNYEVERVVGKLTILKELERRGVLPVVSPDVLNAYLDRLRGDATAPQLELLDRHREALEFLESITEEVA